MQKLSNQIEELEKYFDALPRRQGPLTLSRIKNLLNVLGNPEKKLRGIHIAGTNGKGSTAAACQSILTAGGFKVGLFTSPHLVSPCERIRIGYKNISEKSLLRYLTRIKKIADKLLCSKNKNTNNKFYLSGRPSQKLEQNILTRYNNKISEPVTWFEALTAATILYFVDEKVEVAVFEVGLGGRGDATNVLNLDVGVITNVQMDHKEALGNTLQKICQEKIEIIKKNSYVITGCSGKILKIIEKKCKKENAKLFALNRNIKAKFIKLDNNLTHGDVITPFLKYNDLEISLLGPHQMKNAALAMTACEILNKKGFQISSKNVRVGLKKILWPGRYQIISQKPKIILDGAHNPDGVKTLVQTFKILENNFSTRLETSKKAIILFAAKKKKDVKSMLKILKPIIRQMIFVDMPNSDLFFPAKELKKYYPKAKILTLKPACEYAEKQAKINLHTPRQNVRPVEQTKKYSKSVGIKNEPILLCGSLYFLGEAIKNFKFKNKKVKRLKKIFYP